MSCAGEDISAFCFATNKTTKPHIAVTDALLFTSLFLTPPPLQKKKKEDSTF
jgi:hypothetical protein